MTGKFEQLGFFLEYSVDTKFRGTLKIEEKDREEFGYIGTKSHTATETILLERGKKIKKGENYKTRLFPICGKAIRK